MSSIPYTIAEVTPEAVTELLSQRTGWTDLSIASLESAPVGTGQMANSYRLTLEYTIRPDGAPDTVIAKMSSTDPDSRQMGAATGAYQREVLFYQHLADLTDVRAPDCFSAQITDDHHDFLLLLEDMGPARTVEQIGGCTPDQADSALGQAAALHAGSWGHATLTEQSWLPVEHVWNALAGALPEIVDPWLQRFGSYLELEHVDVLHRLGREIPAWLATLSEHRTLWHGDFRLDNLLFDAQDGRTRIAVVDWQSVAVAPGVIDVSYLLGTSLTEADRVAHERALVGEYHRRLLSAGVTGYDADRCWLEYRAHALYGLVLTVPVSLGVASTERGDAMFGAMARRVAQQIVDNDSFTALTAVTG
ncbi:phosphotransferase [Mycobacterium hackensackense]|uniref:ecdysteroid 22-kinase family protein n=1 Tax=Mycobacterium hackensackense TaxID=228909 RepID=UPI002265A54F|nr:ecdysteroid 22-kinase family protein [Mycobacterium hackensackense]MCV7250605.1 phosphotransferase [Mycobacterium hackensackense]